MTPTAAARLGLPKSTVEQTSTLYREHLDAVYRRTDQLFVILLLLEWVVAVAFALVISPYTWAGESYAPHIHVLAAIFLGAAIVSLPVAFALTQPVL